MSRIYTRVSRVADWAGWCSPCGVEDRPLVLTRSGPGGVHSWLNGLSDDDRVLLLTCRVCGEWQLVPAREEDDPEVLMPEDEVVLPAVREVVAAIVAEARAAVPVAEAPEIVALPELLEVPEPVAAVPAPRPAVERIVTVPDVTLPAYSPEAVAAAAAVLAAARASLEVPPPRRAPRQAAAPAAPALPDVLGLPVGTRQLVLAAAS